MPSRPESLLSKTHGSSSQNVIFDLPLAYNKRVSYWIAYYQTKGKSWFRDWLGLSNRYLPLIQTELKRQDLPQDLAYMVMIESGFKATATSSARAVGPWQFIAPTASRYGLKVNYWLDERRDLKKATLAAIRYLRDLRTEFGSWYLVAASYNMGETNLRRQIQKFQTRDYWTLVRMGALPVETMDYVPKILAAMMIAKAPGLYGFSDVAQLSPLQYEVVEVPGGVHLDIVAEHIGVTTKCLLDLNSELLLGYVPADIEKHAIRVPRGSVQLVAQYLSHFSSSYK